MALRLGIKAAREIGRVCLHIARTTDRVSVVVMVDTARREDGTVNAGERTAVGQVEGADDVGPHGFLLVVFAPVDIRTSRAAGAVEDVRGLDLVQLGLDGFAVLHADGGHVNVLPLALQNAFKVASHPAPATPDQISISSHCKMKFQFVQVESWINGDSPIHYA